MTHMLWPWQVITFVFVHINVSVHFTSYPTRTKQPRWMANIFTEFTRESPWIWSNQSNSQHLSQLPENNSWLRRTRTCQRLTPPPVPVSSDRRRSSWSPIPPASPPCLNLKPPSKSRNWTGHQLIRPMNELWTCTGERVDRSSIYLPIQICA